MDNMPVVTGLSAICSLGSDLSKITEKLFTGNAHVIPAGFSSPSIAGRTMAPIHDFDPKAFLKKRKSHRFMSRETTLAASALSLCMEQSGIRVKSPYKDTDICLFAGTGSSGLDLSTIQTMLDHSAHETTGLFDAVRFGREGLQRMNPLISFKILPNMPVTVGAIENSIKGRNLIFNPWEGNALSALVEACHEIISKRESIAFCGGSDCKTHSDAFIAFAEYGLFDQSDVILSEGSAYVAVEDRDMAQKRGARIWCHIKTIITRSVVSENLMGYTPSPDLYASMMNEALEKSGFVPDDIDLIVDSHDFHKANDEAEKQAMDRVFRSVLTVSPKTIIGNAFAASGFIHLAVAAYILGAGVSVSGRSIRRIMINSFANGSEKQCIIVENT